MNSFVYHIELLFSPIFDRVFPNHLGGMGFYEISAIKLRSILKRN